MNDLTNLIEWTEFASDGKSVLEVLTILNNRHRDTVGDLARQRDEAREELENFKASGIHSCHADCKRPLCVANRSIKALREAIKEASTLLVSVDNGAQQDVNGVNWYDARKSALAKLQPFLKP